MRVVKNNIEVESEFLANLTANPLDFDSIQITTQLNCGQSFYSEVDSLDFKTFKSDLSYIVNSEGEIHGMSFLSLKSFTETFAPFIPIDLGYIEDNCNSNCTIEAYASYYTNLFKNQIDDWFLSIGHTTDVEITFSENTIIIKGLPEDFIPYKFYFGDNLLDTVEIGYGFVEKSIIISGDKMYIKPSYFGWEEIVDGVYTITLKFIKSDNRGHIIEKQCAFLDPKIRCIIADYLSDLSKDSPIDKRNISETIMLMHYALTRTSNCGCNCEELCQLFDDLKYLLGEKTEGCEC